MSQVSETLSQDSGCLRAVRPLTPRVGMEVMGIDLADPAPSDIDFIVETFNTYSAVLFRGQDLTNEELIAFSRHLGELDEAPVNEKGKTAVPGIPELYVVSNILGPDSKPIGSLGAGEAKWHTDMSYLENPPDASLLYALEVPPSGGNTWIAGMFAALDDLPEGLRMRIEGRSIKHDGTYNSGGYVRQGLEANDDPQTCHGTLHPAICTHPATGRPVLYLGRRRNAYVDGLSLKESEALLDALWEHATRPDFCYQHEWRVGDLLMWDNRATLHRRDPFDGGARRLMHRTQIKGKTPPRALRA